MSTRDSAAWSSPTAGRTIATRTTPQVTRTASSGLAHRSPRRPARPETAVRSVTAPVFLRSVAL